MKVVIIGAGNVATNMAKALTEVNVAVIQVWSNQYQNALHLANTINADAINDLSAINNNADLCIIAVKDDAIAKIIPQLVNFKGIIVHTSGSVDIAVFEDVIKKYGVFYPLQTFSKNKAVQFAAIPICIEASNDNTLNTLKELANKLSNNVQKINSEKRKILHLAAVFACNFTNHLYTLAQKILSVNELNFDILRPLIAETADKVQFDLPINVQTGPAIRNDNQTLKEQEKMLKKHPALLDIYIKLSDSIKQKG